MNKVWDQAAQHTVLEESSARSQLKIKENEET